MYNTYARTHRTREHRFQDSTPNVDQTIGEPNNF